MVLTWSTPTILSSKQAGKHGVVVDDVVQKADCSRTNTPFFSSSCRCWCCCSFHSFHFAPFTFRDCRAVAKCFCHFAENDSKQQNVGAYRYNKLKKERKKKSFKIWNMLAYICESSWVESSGGSILARYINKTKLKIKCPTVKAAAWKRASKRKTTTTGKGS